MCDIFKIGIGDTAYDGIAADENNCSYCSLSAPIINYFTYVGEVNPPVIGQDITVTSPDGKTKVYLCCGVRIISRNVIKVGLEPKDGN